MAGTVNSNGTISIFVNVAQALANLDKFQKSFDNGISRMRNMAMGFIGARGLKGYYDSLMSIIDLADRWHLPVEKVSAWINLFSRFGAGTEEAVSSLERLQSLANDLKFSSNGALRELSAILNTNLQKKDYMGVVKALREGMKGLSNDAKTEVMRRLGFDSAAIQRMLEASDEEFAEALKSAQEFGVLNEESAQSLRDMRQTISDIKQILLDIAVPVVEALKPILNVVRDIAIWFGKLPADIQTATLAFVALIPVIKGIIGLFVGGGLVSAIGALANPITWIVLGIAALVAGGVLLYKNWDKVKQKAQELAEKYSGLINIIKAFTLPVQLLAKSLYGIGKAIYDLLTNSEKFSENFVGFRIAAYAIIAPFKILWEVLKGITWALDKINDFFGTKKLTIEEKENANKWLADNGLLTNAEPLNMSPMEKPLVTNSSAAAIEGDHWVGKQSPTTTNDNRSMTFNIYGVDGASDLENRLRTIINNNVSPVTGWAK